MLDCTKSIKLTGQHVTLENLHVILPTICDVQLKSTDTEETPGDCGVLVMLVGVVDRAKCNFINKNKANQWEHRLFFKIGF